MNVLITGGSGFIGSNIVDRLIKENHKVTVLDLWESNEVKVHSEKVLVKQLQCMMSNKSL